jgi:hypothetical protein
VRARANPKTADFTPAKRARAGTGEALSTLRPLRLCQRCRRSFDPREAHDMCRFHSQDFSGETAQVRKASNSMPMGLVRELPN